MLKLNQIKYILKQSSNKIPKKLPQLLNCKKCNGKGYIFKKNSQEILCKSCYGVGIKSYRYF